MKPPFRPHSSEISILEDLVAKMAKFNDPGKLKVLLLGVTEEIVNMTWPENTHLTAVDMSELMIGLLWPGDIKGRRKVVRANWFEMPFPKSSFHLIVGDGAFNFMRYPDGFRNFASVLSEFLLPNGKLCIRIFNQLEQKETPEEVIRYFHKNRRIEFFVFRFRLATCLQESAEKGLFVTKETLDEYMVSQGISLEELYKKSGYIPPKKNRPLPDSEKNSYRITYPTTQQFINQVIPFFEEVQIYNGKHTLAHRTPVFLFSKQKDKISVNRQLKQEISHDFTV